MTAVAFDLAKTADAKLNLEGLQFSILLWISPMGGVPLQSGEPVGYNLQQCQ